MRPVAYLRVSSREQVEGFSIDAQERAIRDYCTAQGWAEPAIYADEGRSGFTDVTEDRPAFSAMLAHATRGDFDVVVVHRLDRFARSLIVTLRELARLEKARVGFVSIGEDMNFATPIGRVFLAMLAALAEYFSRNLSAESRKGIAEKRAQGGHIGGVPYGALRDRAGRLTVDPAHADTLALFLALVADLGHTNAAAALTARGIPSPKGTSWKPPAVHAMVLHGAWLLDQPDPWPSRWSAARTAPRRPRATPNTTRMLTGLARCACGGAIVYGGRTRAKGTERGELCLQCRHFTKDRPKASGCPYRKRLAAYYEARVTDWLLSLPDLRLIPPAPAIDIPALRADVARRRRVLGLALADGNLTEDDYRPRLAALLAEEAALPTASVRTAALAERVAAAQALWPDLTAQERNEILRGLVVRIVITGPDLDIVPIPELATLLDRAPLTL